jgi:AcrR family transcriptional regulator
MSSETQVEAVHPALLEAAGRAVRSSTARRGTFIRDTRTVASRLGASAIRLFAERGFANVTVADIAAEAGVTSRTFHRYFPNKEAVVTDIADVTNQRLVELIRTSGQPDMLSALQEAVATWREEYEDLLDSISKISEISNDLMAALLLNASRWEDRVGEALHARYPDTSRIDARILAAVMMGVLRVATAEATEHGRSARVETNRLMKRIGPVLGISNASEE